MLEQKSDETTVAVIGLDEVEPAEYGPAMIEQSAEQNGGHGEQTVPQADRNYQRFGTVTRIQPRFSTPVCAFR